MTAEEARIIFRHPDTFRCCTRQCVAYRMVAFVGVVDEQGGAVWRTISRNRAYYVFIFFLRANRLALYQVQLLPAPTYVRTHVFPETLLILQYVDTLLQHTKAIQLCCRPKKRLCPAVPCFCTQACCVQRSSACHPAIRHS